MGDQAPRAPRLSFRGLGRGGRPLLVVASLVGLAAMALPWTGWYYSYTANEHWSYTLSSDGTSGLSTGYALPGLALAGMAAILAGLVLVFRQQ